MGDEAPSLASHATGVDTRCAWHRAVPANERDGIVVEERPFRFCLDAGVGRADEGARPSRRSGDVTVRGAKLVGECLDGLGATMQERRRVLQ